MKVFEKKHRVFMNWQKLMRTITIIYILVQTLFLSCNNSSEQKSSVTSADSLKLKLDAIRNDYCLKQFWKGIDTLHFDTVTVFENSLMCYDRLPLGFFSMTHLKFVRLDTETQLDTLTDDIGKLNNIEILEITKSNLKYLPKNIGKLKNLKKLTVAWGMQLTEIPSEIGNLSNLEELDLFRNKLTTLPNEIANLKRLRKLILGENIFTEKERNRISSLLPNCEIQFELNRDYRK